MLGSRVWYNARFLERDEKKKKTVGSSFQLFISCQVVINCKVSELKVKIVKIEKNAKKRNRAKGLVHECA